MRGNYYAVGERPVLVGRGPDCQIVINRPEISQMHCYIMFYWPDQQYIVQDCSRNGVYVPNGARLTRNQMFTFARGGSIVLPSGDVFTFD